MLFAPYLCTRHAVKCCNGSAHKSLEKGFGNAAPLSKTLPMAEHQGRVKCSGTPSVTSDGSSDRLMTPERDEMTEGHAGGLQTDRKSSLTRGEENSPPSMLPLKEGTREREREGEIKGETI